MHSDNLNIDPVIDSINISRSERPVSGSHRKGDNPEIFLIGDSTMRTEVDGNGSNGRFRGLLPGTGKEYEEVILPGNGTRERVYTYGEYLRIYVGEIRAKGANPILLSLTQRNSFDENGKAVPRRQDRYDKGDRRRDGRAFHRLQCGHTL